MNKGGFSWKQALGITRQDQRLSRAIGIRLTKSGRQRKIGRAVTGGGCLVPPARASLVRCHIRRVGVLVVQTRHVRTPGNLFDTEPVGIRHQRAHVATYLVALRAATGRDVLGKGLSRWASEGPASRMALEARALEYRRMVSATARQHAASRRCRLGWKASMALLS